MVLDNEKEQVIRANPKHLKCPSCGHEEDIYAAAAIPQGNGEYTLIFGSAADFCTECDAPWGRAEALQEDAIKQLLEGAGVEIKPMGPIDEAMIKLAREKHPGIPFPLALARQMVEEELLGAGISRLQAGMSWGGIHLETVGELVQMMAQTMSRLRKKSITVTISCENYPEDYGHIEVEITDVDDGNGSTKDKPALAGWPCCACGQLIAEDDVAAVVVLLDKKATWTFPVWGNVLKEGFTGNAAAVLCGSCTAAKKEAKNAVMKEEGDRYTLVPLSELEDV